MRPIPFNFVVTPDSLSFRNFPDGVTGIPVAPHPGAFGVQRKFHTHEGIDLYCPSGTPVYAMESGVVVAVVPFTGPKANFPHWHDTNAVFVEDHDGVWVYGEIQDVVSLHQTVQAGDLLGHVIQVLRNDKGRPMSMLHLERHVQGSRYSPAWNVGEDQPSHLLDPTERLIHHAFHSSH